MNLIVELLSNDVEKSVEFYGTILATKVTQELKDDGRLVWAEIATADGNKLQFYDSQLFTKEVSQFRGVNPGGTFILIFEVADINLIWEKYNNRMEIVDSLKKKEYGTIEFKFKDPDGYIVQVTQRI